MHESSILLNVLASLFSNQLHDPDAWRVSATLLVAALLSIMAAVAWLDDWNKDL